MSSRQFHPGYKREFPEADAEQRVRLCEREVKDLLAKRISSGIEYDRAMEDLHEARHELAILSGSSALAAAELEWQRATGATGSAVRAGASGSKSGADVGSPSSVSQGATHRVGGKIVAVKGSAGRPALPVGTVEKMHSIDVNGEQQAISQRELDALKHIAQRHGDRNPQRFVARLFKKADDKERAAQYLRETVAAVLRGSTFKSFVFSQAGF